MYHHAATYRERLFVCAHESPAVENLESQSGEIRRSGFLPPCWLPARKIDGADMIELDVYYFYWLSTSLHAIETRIVANSPMRSVFQAMVMARLALEEFSGDVATAFPHTADSATELLGVINEIVPPAETSSVDLNAPIPRHYAERIRVLAQGIGAVLRHEGKHSYVVQVQDQRSFSAVTLVEKIENCFPPDAWAIMEPEAKREFEEAGKCLVFERYTSTGFHALRGVECLIRQYIRKLTSELPKKRDWGHYCDVLKQNGADLKLIAVLDNIRSMERNPLMHPEDWLDIDDAVAIFNISQTAVVRLAAGIKPTRLA